MFKSLKTSVLLFFRCWGAGVQNLGRGIKAQNGKYFIFTKSAITKVWYKQNIQKQYLNFAIRSSNLIIKVHVLPII